MSKLQEAKTFKQQVGWATILSLILGGYLVHEESPIAGFIIGGGIVLGLLYICMISVVNELEKEEN